MGVRIDTLTAEQQRYLASGAKEPERRASRGEQPAKFAEGAR